jgi:hypothetical protein
MAKAPDLISITTGYYSTPAITQNFEDLVAALNNTLSLDGSTPNAMTADLDMNGNDILNVNTLYIDGVDVFSVINRVTISTSTPSGGQDGDIWFKVSS